MSAHNPITSTNAAGFTSSLVQYGLLSESDVQLYQQQAIAQDQSLGHYLVTNGLLEPRQAAVAASNYFGLPLLDLNAIDKSALPIDRVSERLIRRHRIIPLFKRGNTLFIGTSDPSNYRCVEEIKFHTRMQVGLVIVEDDKLGRTVDSVLEGTSNAAINALLDEHFENLAVLEDAGEAADLTDATVDEAPIVRFVNKILLDAIKTGASDIHIEPYEKFFRVRFRHDGLLHETITPPTSIAARVAARIKVMSRMDISERRVPQDGRIKLAVTKNKHIDFRVNTCPTLYGEKIVMRILDASDAHIGLDNLGMEAEQRRHFLTAINKPYGMILVTGPTGSGKTVTLYTGLNMLNTIDRNISTAEDPVEITVPGINQVNVNPKAGLTFAEALRAFLRQDPDVIMVGEIRDLETAEIAVKAAQTGHLVLSTLHTNDAPQSLNRMAQMGIAPYNIISSVILIMAQRLARRLCLHCRKPEQIPAKALLAQGFTEADLATGFTIYSPIGCDRCNKGYKGRVGIYQVMPLTDDITRLVLHGGDAMEIANQAQREGIADLRRSGLKKVMLGVTSMEEINRVTKD